MDPILVDLCFNTVPVKMELDTGASLLILSLNTHHSFSRKTDTTSPPLRSTGQAIPVLGKVKISVSYNNHVVDLSIHVVDGVGPDLVGRDWLSQLLLSLEVNHMECKSYVFTCTRQRIGTIRMLYTRVLQYLYAGYTLVYTITLAWHCKLY